MATSRLPARTATKVATKPKPKTKAVPFEAITDIDDDGNYTARIFGEEFTLSAEVNGWLLFLAGSGSSKHVVNLVESLIVIPEGDGDIEVRRRREADRFHGLLASQKPFKIEDAVELVNAMTEFSAGNDN